MQAEVYFHGLVAFVLNVERYSELFYAVCVWGNTILHSLSNSSRKQYRVNLNNLGKAYFFWNAVVFRVLVLDAGQVAEFDTPENLLKAKGIFYSMAKDAGLAY